MVFVKSSITVNEVKSSLLDIEKVSLTLTVQNLSVRLITYYRTPIHSNLREFFDDLEREVSSNDKNSITIGDININTRITTNHLSPTDRIAAEYEEILSSYGYSITNNNQTRCASGKVIDHVACNFAEQHDITNYTVEYDQRFTISLLH